MKRKYYITTPIYYASGNLHLGHTYSTVFADAVARIKRLQGYDVFFLTGSDEHGMKVERKANDSGITPKEYADKIVLEMKKLWEIMGISYDRFIRTTDEYHEKAVQKIFNKLYENGDIYKDNYEGHYCVPCESFFSDEQLIENKCPDCNRDLEWTTEESYFFKADKYQKKLEKLYEYNKEFVVPEVRRKEMLNSFIKPGIKDICVSRTTFKWGIPVTFDPDHVIYVWIDALPNYITALGYMSEDDSLFKKYWPADIQIIGREITRFHSIIWPMILMALDIDIPKRIHSHGWLTTRGNKMGKSLGNGFNPYVLVDRYGLDSVRYYLLKEGPILEDSDYTNERFINTINSDLSNNLGNLVSRTVAMINQNFCGIVPEPKEYNDLDNVVIKLAENTYKEFTKNFNDNINTNKSIESVMSLLKRSNKYIDETTPWLLAKDISKKDRLATVLFVLAENIRISTVLLQGILLETPNKIFKCLGMSDDNYLKSHKSTKKYDRGMIGKKTSEIPILFNRFNVDEEIKYLTDKK